MAESLIPTTLTLIEEGCRSGQHSGAQIYMAHQGKTIVDMAVGESHDGIMMCPDTLFHWLSSTKPIAAVAICQLWERGLLAMDDLVYHHIPEFGIRGKEGISIRHILTHTAGIRGVDVGGFRTPWDETIRRICAMPVEKNWKIGKKAGYHLASSWFILGELIRRLDGRPFNKYVRDEIFLPLEMFDSWIGMPQKEYDHYHHRIGRLYDTGKNEPELTDWHTAASCAWVAPGSHGKGPMRELGRFYEMLLNQGEWKQRRILSPQSIAALTARHRTGIFDHTFQHMIDWGLGFIINSNLYGAETVPYGYGLHSSNRCFGHSGRQSSTAFADPEHDLVVALAFNGTPGERAHNRRIRDVLTAIYEDLGLVD